MNTKNILVVAICLIIGGLAGYGIASASKKEDAFKPADTMMDHSKMTMDDTMDSMTAGLEGKDGDAFDKAFLSGMIDHHQGAIDMANLALQHANHDEIKNMAKAIISAQSEEIQQMKEWQKNWYGR